MSVLFWLSFFVIVYSYFGYPLLLILLSLSKGTEKIDGSNNWFEPSVSLIIPVHNEERIIKQKIQNTLLLDYPKDKIEILIVSDASTDKTKEIVLSYGTNKVMFFEQPHREGKASALNRGLQEAKHEIVVFTDASIFLEKIALRNILRRFSDDQIGCVSGEDYIAESQGEGAYGKYELFLRSLEGRLGSIVGASGCFYAQRLNLCEPFPEGMAPDFFSVLKTVEKGFRAVSEPRAKGFMHSVPNNKDEFERKVRTLLRGITTLLAFKHLLNPIRYGIFAVQLMSHKIIRWLVGLFLVLFFLSNLFLLQSGPYNLIFLLQIIFYGLAIIAWIVPSAPTVFRVPLFFSMVNLSTLIAWHKYIKGFRQEIWEPSKR
jgi:glycosyltransferase involved in cell wall biosynthesis